MGRGLSRPNINQYFTDPVTNAAAIVFSGAGIRVPVGRHVNVFGEARFALTVERDVVMPTVPIRAGLAWNF
jgi:hypothetical protein